MSNGTDTQTNCIVEACCGEDKPKQIRALSAFLRHDLPTLDTATADAVAKVMCLAFDFAPVGTLYEFKEAIIKLSRGKPFEG